MKRLFVTLVAMVVSASQADVVLAKGPGGGNGGGGKSIGGQFKGTGGSSQFKGMGNAQFAKNGGNSQFKGNGQFHKNQHGHNHNHHGHHHHGHFHGHHRHFHADWCYPRSYSSWRHYCWYPDYGCYCYYCPTASCWYYWYEPQGCYLPVSYINSYAPAPTVSVINNNNVNANSVGGVPPLPQGAVSVPPGGVPLPVGVNGPGPGLLPKS
jgi:hypothetical protein